MYDSYLVVNITLKQLNFTLITLTRNVLFITLRLF